MNDHSAGENIAGKVTAATSTTGGKDRCPECGAKDNPNEHYEYECGSGWYMKNGKPDGFYDGVDCLKYQLAQARKQIAELTKKYKATTNLRHQITEADKRITTLEAALKPFADSHSEFYVGYEDSADFHRAAEAMKA